MEQHNKFESQTCALGTWVPIFVAKREIYNSTSNGERLGKSISDSVLTLIQYITPTYICFHVDHILMVVGTDVGLAILI